MQSRDYDIELKELLADWPKQNVLVEGVVTPPSAPDDKWIETKWVTSEGEEWERKANANP